MIRLARGPAMAVMALSFVVFMRVAAVESEEVPLRDRLQPVGKNTGFRMDGYFVWCDFHLRIRISTADSFRGPYCVANDNVWPNGQVEDFFFFKHQGQFHLICEDSAGTITGHKKWGAHLYSEDGIHSTHHRVIARVPMP